MSWFAEHITLDLPRWLYLVALVWGFASAAVWWLWRDAVERWQRSEFRFRATRNALRKNNQRNESDAA